MHCIRILAIFAFAAVGLSADIDRTVVGRQRRSAWNEFFNSLAEAAETAFHAKPALRAESANKGGALGKMLASEIAGDSKRANVMLKESPGKKSSMEVDEHVEKFAKNADSLSLIHENANTFEQTIINHIIAFVGVPKYDGIRNLRKNGLNNKESENVIKNILEMDYDFKHLIIHNIDTIKRMREDLEKKAVEVLELKDFFFHEDMNDVKRRLKETRKANLKWLEYQRDPGLLKEGEQV